ncbi:MAG: pyridoxamine 5'-phosphate oxidase [Chlorobia bacterium]|nr:pyridoxamine 5'-phosphate oxidase [Fimbriimonadaceae bacterium]
MAERLEYTRGRLSEHDVAKNPLDQFAHWLQDAIADKVVEPTAMCLSTVGPDGKPSSRIVLLRGQDEFGFTFFTNYLSRKGQEISGSQWGCLNFWWGSLERQIRIEGSIERVSPEESDSYWRDRPYESRLASAASPQSQVVENREELVAMVEQVRIDRADDVLRPAHWGGYRLVPEYFEFWQGGPARLHDRLVYQRTADQWTIKRLAP